MENKDEIAIQLALEIENRGIKYYNSLKKHFDPASVKYKTLDLLELQEHKHKKIYEQMLKENQNGKIITLNEEDYRFIKTLVEGKIFDLMNEITKIKIPNFNLSDILFDCIEVELDTVYFFRKLAFNLIPSQAKLINEIIKEENEHIDLLFDLRVQYRIENKIL